MISIIDEKDCCGCGACSAICPKKCIEMKEEMLGHLFPKVDTDICIDCHLCEKVCPMLSKPKNSEFKQEAYAAYSKDPKLRYEGSSGGMFGVFATNLINDNYVVYGAAFDEKLNLKCTKASTIEELMPLMKSKYLQSKLLDKFEEIKKLLNSGKKVLFVSTPCQVSALKNFLCRDYDNLVTVDFFCHGVPSQKFFDQCLTIDEKKYGGKISNFRFREKKINGSTPHYFSIDIDYKGKKKKVLDYYFKSTFYLAFQKYINLRESCYNCPFAYQERYSDITIGDFHDIDKYIDGINRFDGVSTVIINSNKGKKIWDNCSNNLQIWSVDLEMLINDGVCLSGGTKRPSNRDEFLLDYSNMTFEAFSKKWMNSKKYWKNQLYYSMPKRIRDILVKFIGG